LVPPFDLREYARQLERLMADDELRSRIARGGKQSVQRFSVESVGAHWVKFLESI
jgi:glycosyltransferase involved in cell wall biosynthesis